MIHSMKQTQPTPNSSSAKPVRLPHKRNTKPSTLLLRIRELMPVRGIRNIAELARLLGDRGIDISNAQLGRVADNHVSKLDRDLLAGLLQVLDCTPAELFAIGSRDGKN